jgi:hypothetical protein
LLVVQDRVELWPAVMLVGVAVSVAVGLLTIELPVPAPQAVSAISEKTAARETTMETIAGTGRRVAVKVTPCLH